MIDIEPVDLLDRRRADADARGLGTNFHSQFGPRLRIESLGIVDPGDIGLRRKHDRRRDNGPCERTDPRFIDPGDVAHAGLPQELLEMPHRLEAQALVTLALITLFQDGEEPPRALPGIALQPRQEPRRYGLFVIEVLLPDLLDR